jgi:hypothetical protein
MPAYKILQHAATSTMWRRVAFHALWLNAIWEIVQCWWLYDMGAQSWTVRATWIVAATVGDVLLILAIWKVAQWMQPSAKVPFLSLVLVGIVVGFVIEWIALSLGLWDYAPATPIIQVGRHRIGLSPVVQMSVLPLLSVMLSARNLRQKP